MTNQLAKTLTLLLISSLIWGGIFAMAAFWIFGASISIVWTIGLSIFGSMLLCIFLMGCEFFLSLDPRDLQDDEGNEFVAALLLGSSKF